MDRRTFLGASGAFGLASIGGLAVDAANPVPGDRDYYLLQQYLIDTEEQRKLLDTFIAEAAIPMLNRLGINPVGAFYPQRDLSPVTIISRHPSLQSFTTLADKAMADEQFTRAGAPFLDAPASAPAFKRVETSLLLAFKDMPKIERPVDAPGRVLQLRIYESASFQAAKKKIEMFNDGGEIAIFRRVGLNPVFFGETLIGTQMPNLTYMLAFRDTQEQEAAWKRFGDDPEWKTLSAMPEYANEKIVSNITNLLLKPASYSQI
jgi:hypothetical protein